MEKNSWKQSGNYFKISEPESNTVPVLEPGIYQMYEGMTGPYLVKNSDKFEFQYKLYDISQDFIERVVRTYNNTKGNLGLLLNGVKGTGKTVTAELICNALKMPIILLTDKMDIEGFLQTIHQDVVVFVDEYEKVFKDEDGKGKKKDLLSTMDGVLNSEYRRVFIFTTNEKRISENLLQRPGRIRYIKEFGNLSLHAIMEVVEDMLKHKHLYEQTVKFISHLDLITMDIIKCVISEVNIHEEDPEVFKDVFNVTEVQDAYSVYTVNDNKRNMFAFESNLVYPANIDEDNIGDSFTVNHKRIGTIVNIYENGEFDVESTQYKERKPGETHNQSINVVSRYYIEQVKGKNEAFLVNQLT